LDEIAYKNNFVQINFVKKMSIFIKKLKNRIKAKKTLAKYKKVT